MSELTQLYEQVRSCTRCALHQSRTRAVPGEGREDAGIVFIGEAPGFHEDRQGRPFVGAAGNFLDELLKMIGLRREDVYICNVLKCRPPQNRDPLASEIEVCQRWLDRQIELIRPQVIVTLGRYSMVRYFPGKSISKIHGTALRKGSVIYYAMYHPATALHQQSLRRAIEADMRKIPEFLAEAARLPRPQGETKAEQLSMF